MFAHSTLTGDVDGGELKLNNISVHNRSFQPQRCAASSFPASLADDPRICFGWSSWGVAWDYSEVIWNKLLYTPSRKTTEPQKVDSCFFPVFLSFFGPGLGEAVSLPFCQSDQGETDVVNQIHKEINEDDPNIWEADTLVSLSGRVSPKLLHQISWNVLKWARCPEM